MVYKPDIPTETIENWQRIVDLMAKTTNTPAGLIMRLESEKTISVFVASATDGNVWKAGDSCPYDPGLYCEEVIRRGDSLLVPNALNDPDWDENPDIDLGMTFYLGFPLYWPDGEPFGTICVLDVNDTNDAVKCRDLMEQFKKIVETDLKLLVEISERKAAQTELLGIKKNLEKRVADRTKRLKEVNTALKVLLREYELTKKEVESSMLANINELIIPNLHKAMRVKDESKRTRCLELVESGLRNITCSFSSELVQHCNNLTPTEIQVANLIRQGKKTKEIADHLNTATSTVSFHRANIRRKMGLSSRTLSLHSHLISKLN